MGNVPFCDVRPGLLMSKILQVFYFICYGLAALAIAFMAPKIFPETPHAVAWLAGAVVFLAGALMHEIASRCYQASLDRHRIAVLHRAYVEAMDDLDRLSVDLRALKRTVSGNGAPVAQAIRSEAAESEPAAAPVRREPEPDAPAWANLDPIVEDEPGSEAFADPPEPADAPTPEGAAAPSVPQTAEEKLLTSLVQRLDGPRGRTQRAADDPFGSGAGSLIERETLDTVREALVENRLDLYRQAVVTLPQRKEKHQDCDIRIASDGGDFMPPSLYNEILRANGLLQPVEDLFLFRTVQLLSATPPLAAGSYAFCKIQPESLADAAFFRQFTDFLKGEDDLVSSIAFEFREADLIDLDDTGAQALGSLVDLGFNLCVSHLHNFDVEADRLSDGGVRFVKIDVEALMPAIGDETEMARVRRMKHGFDDAGIDLIVTGVANEQLLVELLDFDIEFGQGPLFGDPRRTGQPAPAADEGRRGRL